MTGGRAVACHTRRRYRGLSPWPGFEPQRVAQRDARYPMLPTLVLVGRPNVGKSTLFNRLTQTRAALVADFPGLTRDRHFGRGKGAERPYLVVDTGGFEPKAKDGIMHAMAKQTRQAIAEGDVIVFLVDGREGVTAQDKTIADLLRKTGRPVVVAVNKSEGLAPERVTAEFHELALGSPIPISSAHGENVADLVEEALALCPPVTAARCRHRRSSRGARQGGHRRPAERRQIDADQHAAGRGARYRLRQARHDARFALSGLRPRRPPLHADRHRRRAPPGKVTETIEKFSVIKTLQAIEDANVVVLVLDAQAEISEQDAHLAGYILEAGRALVIAVNKWDGLSAERPRPRSSANSTASWRFSPSPIRTRFRHATAKGIGPAAEIGRYGLCRGDGKAADAQAHAGAGGCHRPAATTAQRLVRPKLRYAHQGGMNPPLIVIHGSALAHVPETYRRFLEHFFMNVFQLRGTPLRIQFNTGPNPYAAAPRTGGPIARKSRSGMSDRRNKPDLRLKCVPWAPFSARDLHLPRRSTQYDGNPSTPNASGTGRDDTVGQTHQAWHRLPTTSGAQQ